MASLGLVLALSVAGMIFAPVTARADTTWVIDTQGSLTVAIGTDYVITQSDPSTSTVNIITVPNGYNGKITLNNVNIYVWAGYTCAFELQGNAKVALLLQTGQRAVRASAAAFRAQAVARLL